MRKNIFRFLITLAALTVPITGYAYFNDNPNQIQSCPVGSLSCASDLGTYLAPVLDHVRYVVFGGLVAGALIYLALKMLFSASNENTVTETKQAIEYTITGAILVYGAGLIAESFGTPGNLNPSGINPLLLTIVTFVKGILAAGLIVNIALQGFFMITATDDAAITKARTRFIHGLIGAVIVMLASPLVNMVFGINIGEGVTEVVGIANFIITIFGFLDACAVILSGIMYVVSIDESLKEKAKKLLTGSLIVLLIVICSAAFVNFFIFA